MLQVPLRVLKSIWGFSARLRGRPIFPPDFFEMVGLNWCFNSRKAQTELGWQPHTFETAMTETWQTYQAMGWKPA